jgi:hypothetical protein
MKLDTETHSTQSPMAIATHSADRSPSSMSVSDSPMAEPKVISRKPIAAANTAPAKMAGQST